MRRILAAVLVLPALTVGAAPRIHYGVGDGSSEAQAVTILGAAGEDGGSRPNMPG